MKCNLIIFKSYRLHFGLGDEGKEDVVKNEARFSLTKRCGFLVTPTLVVTYKTKTKVGLQWSFYKYVTSCMRPKLRKHSNWD